MSEHPAFELVREQAIPEINSVGRLYRHRKTGAEVLSLINDDENKVFGITFKTPPEDSTGVAHILEHSVLCGSRKYPVKKPFVELLKGSLHTFLNAMTFSDKTAYPVASTNLQDFYNLTDVYLDAVFFPLITEDTFRQEGWHYELDNTQGPMVYKGVVFNEMKGAYSSPDAVLGKLSQQSLYPDTTYGVNSGGDPKAIPDLTYQYFKDFHARFYHPSNARVVFYGDDDPAKRLEILEEYFSQFEPIDPRSEIALQARWDAPRQVHDTYAANAVEPGARTAMVTVNWMLDPITSDSDLMLSLGMLESILLGNAAAPLRKALIDSGLGSGLTGSGFAENLQQPYYTFGLKGIDAADAPKVEALIIDTLRKLADEGIDKKTVEAAMNTAEFALRENNTGSFPRGISLMFRSMGPWLNGGDPFEPLAFEAPLGRLKDRLSNGETVFEDLIRKHLLENSHRTTVLLTADTEMGAAETAEEQARLDVARSTMTPLALEEVSKTAQKLKTLQETPDKPEDLARIPTLTLGDLPRFNKQIPIEHETIAGVRTFTHDLPTSGVIYLDVGFDVTGVPGRLLPYLPIFSRALTSTGTSKEDFVSLTQRIGRSTGGISINRWAGTKRGSEGIAAYLFARGKAVPDKAEELLAILHDVLTDAQLGNRARIKQMVMESKAGFEGSMAHMGNGLVSTRLQSQFTETAWFNEKTGGISQYFFIRELVDRVDNDWPAVEAALVELRNLLLVRERMVLNVTAEGPSIEAFRPKLASFVEGLPHGTAGGSSWGFEPNRQSEGLTFPGQVNYVAKGGNLKQLGLKPTGGMAVAVTHLNTYMWDKIRVQGGAYGGSAGWDPFSGNFTFTSYRDPGLLETLKSYDAAAKWLRQPLGEQALTRSVIGVIGTLDSYQLPDAKGFTSMLWELIEDTEQARQKRREEVLDASHADFSALAEALEQLVQQGQVVVLGSETAIKAANDENGQFLKVTRVL
jgi:Zn-dependent M16 (insulinase) family peptidase